MESLIKVKDGQQMESPRGGLGMVKRGDSFVAGGKYRTGCGGQ